MDRRLAIIVCSHCDAIFDLTTRKNSTSDPEFSSKTQSCGERAAVSLPKGFKVEYQKGQIRVSIRWFKPLFVYLFFFAIAWNSFLVGWYYLVSSIGTSFAILFYIVPVIFIFVRLKLSVRHFPLPWYPAPTIPLSHIEQIYVTREVRRNQDSTTVSFSVRAVTRDNKNQLLLRSLEDLEQALWLEQEIETTLGIRDRRVAGEFNSNQVHV